MPINKNMEHVWSVICQKGIVDRETNLLTIVDVFEKLTLAASESSPFNGKDVVQVPFAYEVVTFWRRKSGEKQIEGDILLKIFSPKNKEIASFPVKFQFPANAKNFRAKVRMNALPVIDEGEYKLIVMEKQKTGYMAVTEIPYDIVLDKNGIMFTNKT